MSVVEQNDGTMKEVGTIWESGSESVKFSMRNGDYVFTFTSEPDSITVEYSDSGYYERVMKYDLADTSSARLTVSNYDSKAVCCLRSQRNNTVMYSYETVFAYELPEDQLFDYKNPNK